MRIGKQCKDFRSFLDSHNKHEQLKSHNSKSIVPKWCKPFGLDSGSSFRPLYVVNNVIGGGGGEKELANNYEYNSEGSSFLNATNNSSLNTPFSSSSSATFLNPDWVYYIGIEIKTGKGLLKDTTFVYFSTRFYMVNRTERDLILSQFHFVRAAREQNVSELTWTSGGRKKGRGIENDFSFLRAFSYSTTAAKISAEAQNQPPEHSLTLVSNSMSQFHWPRSDFDQLLSVKVNFYLDIQVYLLFGGEIQSVFFFFNDFCFLSKSGSMIYYFKEN